MTRTMNTKRGLFSLLTVGMVIFGAGCGQSDPEISGGGVAPAEAPRVPESLTLYSWDDYFDPELLERFEEETGIRIDYEVFGTTDEMEARLRSEPGRYDVLVVDDSIIGRMRDLKLIRPLDHSLLPNLANTSSDYLDKPFDPRNEYSAPYVWGSTLVAYRKDRVGEPEPSWKLLWDTALKGRVMMIEEDYEVFGIALMLEGLDPNSSDPAAFDKALARLTDQVSTMEVEYGDDVAVKEALVDGRIWAAMCYSGDAGMIAEEDPNIDYFVPREGALLWIDSFVVARDSLKSEAAHQFVNFMLEAEAAAASSNYTRCASPSETALPLIDEDLRNDARVFPDREVASRSRFMNKLDAERQRLIHQNWLSLQRAIVEVAENVGGSPGDALGAADEAEPSEVAEPVAIDGPDSLE